MACDIQEHPVSRATDPPGFGGSGGSDLDVGLVLIGFFFPRRRGTGERKVATMPAKVTASPDSAVMMAATPIGSMSGQLQERLDRERRLRAIALRREYMELNTALAHAQLELAELTSRSDRLRTSLLGETDV